MDSFLAMGGYAAFVWPAYGVTLVILAGLLVASWRGLRAREAELQLAESAAAEQRPRRARARA
jgi:heme exporter protein D